MILASLKDSDKPSFDGHIHTCPRVKRVIQSLFLGSCLALTGGCSAAGKSDTFTLTADMPPGFAYVAKVTYVPVPGQSCNLGRYNNVKQQFNREWWAEYKPDVEIEIHRTRKGCELVLNGIDLEINGVYGKDFGDSGGDSGFIAVRDYLDAHHKGAFNAAGESEFSGQCQWLFRTIGPKRYITKILDCKSTDAQGNVTKGRPFAAYTLDQLPGKTVKLKIKLADEEEPFMGDTWVKVPGGWKRCLGDSFEDQDAFCNGNHKDFSTFRMPDGRDTCTIYPGCTENKEVTP